MGDSKDSQPLIFIDEVAENDVLLGRGTGPNEHLGNKKYRSLVLQRKEEYTRTSKRSEKNDIAKWLYDKITVEHNGRFVRAVDMETSDKKIKYQTTRYLVVDKSVAMEKIRQSMRQALNRPKPASPSKKNGSVSVHVGPAASCNVGTKAASQVNQQASTLKPSNGGTSKQANNPVQAQQQQQTPKKDQVRQPPPPPEDLQRYKLTLSYDGTRFKGWQRQSSSSTLQDKSPGNIADDLGEPRPTNIRNMKKRKHDELGRVKPIPVTVQESLEDALEMYSSLDRAALRMRMAGRTDAGVHARGQVVAISLPKPGNKSHPTQDTELWQIRRAINSRLAMDVSVDAISLCDESFDPRHDVVSKQYSYSLRYRRKALDTNGKILSICEKGGPQLLRQAFDPSCLWIVPWALDDSKMEQYCQLLSGDRDFAAFVHKEARDGRDNCKPITRFACKRTKAALPDDGVFDVRFEIESHGFGRSQVRNFVGFIVDLCRGEVAGYETVADWLWMDPVDEVAKKINQAPACGLCLEKVQYAPVKEM